ncbi:MAG: lysophospholipid acyltransferase family protein [Eubacteriales bacterium]|nr:lysophospholipid acyltransferase family protein [Eubacteriales bacterium]
MKRIILMFLLNFFYAPVTLIKLSYYSHHRDKYSREFLYNFLQDITFHALKGGKVTVITEGAQNIPTDSNFIFFPNHQGFFDVLAIIAGCNIPFSVVYKKEVKNIPFLKDVFKCLYALDIDRKDVRQSLTVINKMADEVKMGHNFLIFAEGTRSRQGNTLLDFKGGSFKSAYKAKCPVVPVALIDTYKPFDIGDIKPVSVTVKYLPPIPYEEYSSLKTHELAALVKSKIQGAIDV